MEKRKKLNIVIAFSILIAGVLISGYLVLSAKVGSADLSSQLASLFKFTAPQDQNEKTKDADNDGLTDWQEEIYKTDPIKSDTDGDSYLDGEEVLSGYDPLKPAPDDKLLQTAIEPRPKAGSLAINLTEELGKALVENMRKTKPNFNLRGEVGLETQMDIMVGNALTQALAKSPQLYFIPVIQDSDIKISNETNEQAVRDYVHKVTVALATNFQAKDFEVQDGLTALNQAMQTNNFSEVDKYINGYKKSFQEIKEITVPITWKEIHKKNLSLILASANIFEAVKSAQDDPLKQSLALQQYQQIVLPGFEQMFNEIGELLKQ